MINYEIHQNKKIVAIQKDPFLDFELLDSILFEIKDIVGDFSIVIMEMGESFESVAYGYRVFFDILKKYNIKNRIVILSESESPEYINWINEFGWDIVTYYGFFDTIDMDVHRTNPEARWMQQNHIPNWIYKKVPTIKTELFKKKFLTLNRSFRNKQHEHRIDLYNHLKSSNLLNESYASFKFIPEFDNNFGEECNWEDIRDNLNHYLHKESMFIWDDAFLQIVSESRTYPHEIKLVTRNSPDIELEFKSDYFTEKTTKAIASNMPFVIIGVSGILKRLHKIGFKTFGEFWDESYDEIEDYSERFEKIKEIINWVASKDLKELTDIYNKMIPIFEHNKMVLNNIPEINKQAVTKYIPQFFNEKNEII